MVNTELHGVQLVIWYIRLLTTLKLDKLPGATLYCQAVCWVSLIVEKWSEVFDHSVRMRTITAVLGSHEFRLRIWLGAQGGSQISTRSEDFAGGSAVLPTLSEGLKIVLSDCEAENAMLKDNYLRQVVEIVIGGVLTILQVHFMYLFMSLSWILVQGSVSTNPSGPMRHQVDLWNVEVGI